MLCMSSFHRLSSSCPTENNLKNYYFVLSYDIDLRSPSHFTRTWGSESGEEQREEPSLPSPAPQIILLWQFSTSLIKMITLSITWIHIICWVTAVQLVIGISKPVWVGFTPFPWILKGWHQKHKMANALCFKNMSFNHPSDSKYGWKSPN